MIKLSEHAEQTILFEWLKVMSRRHPELALAFAIPNGGHRNKSTGAMLKREGVKAGVPDLFIPVARGGFRGLFIEMKSKTGRATKEQKKWLNDLSEQGYLATICKGADEAILVIKKYFGI